MQAPFNNLIVKLQTKYVAHFSAVMKQSQLVNQTTFNAADLVQIVGEVVSLPRAITPTPEYRGYSTDGIKVGDHIIFRYDVVYAFSAKDGSFKNMVWYKEQEYWFVDIQKVFAVIRDGEIIMQNGYCMLENIEMPSKLFVPAELKKELSIGQATLTGIGKNRTGLPQVEAKRYDTVYVNPSTIQHYEIKKRKFGIVEQRQIFGSDSPIVQEN